MDDGIIKLEFKNDLHGLMVSVSSLRKFLKQTKSFDTLKNIEYMEGEYNLHKDGFGEFTNTKLYDVKPGSAL